MTSWWAKRWIGAVALVAVVGACGRAVPSPPAASIPVVDVTVPPVSARPSAATTPLTPAPTVGPTDLGPSLTPVPGVGNEVPDRVLAAIHDWAAGSLVDLTPDLEPWGLALDGTVDDVVLSTSGSTADNLCLDPDFAQGAPCPRIVLPDGNVRFDRGRVDAKGTSTVTVAIRRPDGSGVLLEAGNFRMDPPPVLVSGQPRPTPEITRPDPILTLDELIDLAGAIATATSGCSATSCR